MYIIEGKAKILRTLGYCADTNKPKKVQHSQYAFLNGAFLGAFPKLSKGCTLQVDFCEQNFFFAKHRKVEINLLQRA